MLSQCAAMRGGTVQPINFLKPRWGGGPADTQGLGCLGIIENGETLNKHGIIIPPVKHINE